MTRATSQRRQEGGDLPGECKQAKILGDLIARGQARQQRAAGRLHRRRDEPDDDREGEEYPLAGRGERRRARRLGIHVDEVEHVRGIDREDAEGADEQDEQRRDDDELGADAVVEPAADEGAEGADQGQDDAEQAELQRDPSRTPRRRRCRRT